MDVFALVEPSDGTNPGHMAIGLRFFGFHFDPHDLPAEYQPQGRWQEYLFANKVPGSIRDDLTYVRRARSVNADAFLERRVACEMAIEMVLPPNEQWFHFAVYSFNPDDFHSDANPRYNCVTWAILIGNTLAPGFLKPVRQGRIKLILRQMRTANDRAGGASNGQ